MIGIGGRKGTGKGVVAQHLVTKYGFHLIGFADYLKELCCNVFDLTIEQCEYPSLKNKFFGESIMLNAEAIGRMVSYICELPYYGKHNYSKFCDSIHGLTKGDKTKMFISPRDILQYVGTEVLRDCIDPDFHVRVTYYNILKKEISLDKVVIHDARFPNERQFLRNINSKLIFVLEMTDMIQPRKDAHRSETGMGEMGEYDLVLVNDKRKGLKHFERILDVYDMGNL